MDKDRLANYAIIHQAQERRATPLIEIAGQQVPCEVYPLSARHVIAASGRTFLVEEEGDGAILVLPKGYILPTPSQEGKRLPIGKFIPIYDEE